MFFASPWSKQVWPNIAACWSPRIPATGTPPSAVPFASPYSSEEDLISGSIDSGIPIRSRLGWCHSSVSRFISIVRDALVTSVAWTPPSVPPVRFQSTQVSMLPKASSPASARLRAPSTLSRIHLIFGPEK